MKRQTVDKELHRKLPQAGRPRIHWRWYWFRNAARTIRAAWRERRFDLMCLAFYMSTRGANFAEIWVGPVNIIWPMRWLEAPARQLHPEVFKHRPTPTDAGHREGGE